VTSQKSAFTVSLEKYFDSKFAYLEKWIAEKFTAVEKSTESSRVSMEKRLEGMNEFRDTLRDQASQFVTRNTLDAQLTNISKDLQLLKENKANIEGKASMTSFYISIGIAVLSFILAGIKLFIK